MTDQGDEAASIQEADFQIALRNHAARPRLLPSGRCRWCEEPLEDSRSLFCDGDCREDYEKRQKNL